MAHLMIWRLEHVTCSKDIDQYGVHHGPYENPCRYYFGQDFDGFWKYLESPLPEFGISRMAPRRISPRERCGVTDYQIRHWWGETPDEIRTKQPNWAQLGWFFVRYKVSREGSRKDRQQIVFLPRYVLSRTVMPWQEVPLPYPGKVLSFR